MLSSLAEVEADIDGIKGGLPTDVMAQFKGKSGKTNIPERQCLKREFLIPYMKCKIKEQLENVENIKLGIE